MRLRQRGSRAQLYSTRLSDREEGKNTAQASPAEHGVK